MILSNLYPPRLLSLPLLQYAFSLTAHAAYSLADALSRHLRTSAGMQRAKVNPAQVSAPNLGQQSAEQSSGSHPIEAASQAGRVNDWGAQLINSGTALPALAVQQSVERLLPENYQPASSQDFAVADVPSLGVPPFAQQLGSSDNSKVVHHSVFQIGSSALPAVNHESVAREKLMLPASVVHSMPTQPFFHWADRLRSSSSSTESKPPSEALQCDWVAAAHNVPPDAPRVAHNPSESLKTPVLDLLADGMRGFGKSLFAAPFADDVADVQLSQLIRHKSTASAIVGKNLQGGVATAAYPHPYADSRAPTQVHLNGPMVQQITIHTTELPQGLTDLREKVEEIFLDILNTNTGN